MTNNTSINSVGIIGLGSFGRFVASIIPDSVRVMGYDLGKQKTARGVEYAELTKVASADVVILAVPLDAIANVLEEIKNVLKPETVVMDVCSVKVQPEQLYELHLPDHQNLLLTHPLFGPQSAADSTSGHKLIVTKSTGDRAETIIRFCQQSLNLDVSRISAEQHDKIMAQVHALTFFIARGLAGMDLKNEVITTPSYQMILDLIGLDRAHSEELFNTIQLGNPFAKAIREQLLDSLKLTEKELKKQEIKHEV